MNDLKFAVRLLSRKPGFTTVAILTLGIGIGACTALFSVANQMVVNPTSVKDADRTFQLNYVFEDGGQTVGLGSSALQEIFKNTNDRFTAVTVFQFTTLKFESEGFIDNLSAYNVTPGFFSFMDTPPMLGQGFSETDTSAAGDPAIVLSHRTWKSRFAGNKDLIGKLIRLGENSFTLVGVMPPQFRFPSGVAECWLPLSHDQIAARRNSFMWGTLVKLAPDVSQTQALAYIETLADAEMAGMKRPLRPIPTIKPLREMFVSEKLEPTVWALSAAVLLVLLITWANIGNLLLARTQGRVKEMAIRGALGADRFQIARLLLAETLAKSVAPALHEALRSLDPAQPVGTPEIIEDFLRQRDTGPRTALLILFSLAAVGLFLSMIGVAGVIAFTVAERQREIGIRMALGSSRARMLRLILWQGGRSTLIGALPGAAIGMLLISAMPVNVLGEKPSPFDPLALALVTVVVVASFLFASMIPARRASNLNPMEALRHE